ncbi:MAG TPA: prepilin-type N-terminal cleavage/methylation domain-containing protein [Gemmatimonadaceae bacterium]|nr:prepilin-type N-terminal cleavage/methylation domain-containing protein [Gemmatimonadaceae bacterium]
MPPRSAGRTRARRGFSLAELMISMVLVGVIGAAATKLMLSESRLYNIQKARREARAVSRSSTNVLFSDLRMVNLGASAPGSVLIASPETLKVRVPYAFGMVCGSGAATTASMFAADSMVSASAAFAGYAWRDRTTSRFTYVPVGTALTPLVHSASTSTCLSTAQIRVDTVNGRTFQVNGLAGPVDLTPAAPLAQPGAAVFLYQEVMYWFARSAVYPDSTRVGLWRRATGADSVELMAPFDRSAKFTYYRRGLDAADITTATSTTTPPLDSIVGVAIALNGSSPTSTITRTPVRTRVVTSVFFRNRRGF